MSSTPANPLLGTWHLAPVSLGDRLWRRPRLSGESVVQQVRMSLNPSFVGSEQVRDLRFDTEGRRTLSTSNTVPGSHVARHHRLTWERR